MITIIVIAVVAHVMFHAGHRHASYRHARARGHGRGPSLHIGAPGPWITIPGPFHTRIGHWSADACSYLASRSAWTSGPTGGCRCCNWTAATGQRTGCSLTSAC